MMNKKHLALLMAIPLCAGCAVAGTALSAVDANAEGALSTTLTAVPNAVFGADYGFVEADGVSYSVKVAADLFNKEAQDYGLTDFEEHTDNVLKTNGSVNMSDWKWEFTANASLVFVFKATKAGEVSFDFTSANIAGGNAFADAWNTVFSVHRLAADGTLTTLVDCYQKADRVSSGISFNSTDDIWTQYKKKLTGTYALAENETLYWEFGTSVAEGARSIANVSAAKLAYTLTSEPKPEPEPEQGKELYSVKLGDMPKKIGENNFGAVEGSGFDYCAYVGPLNAAGGVENYGLTPFDVKATDNQLKLSSNDKIIFENWRWIFGNTSIVFEYKIKQDGVLCFDYADAPLTNSYLQGWPMMFSVYKKTGDTLDTLVNYRDQKDTVSQNSASTSAALSVEELHTILTREVEVKAGDTVYYEIGSTGNSECLQGIQNGRVVLREKAATPDPKPEPQPGETVQSVTFNDLPTNIKNANYGFVEIANMKYTAKAGPFNADTADYGLVPFDGYTDGGSENGLTCSSKAGLSFLNWKWAVPGGTSVVLVIESKIDGTISFDYSETTNLNGWMEWPCFFRLHVKQADGTPKTLINYYHSGHGVQYDYPGKDASWKEWAKLLTVGIEVNVGDVIYYEIGADNNTGYNVQNFTAAKIVATPNDEVVLAKEEYGAKLKELYTSLTEGDFTAENWATIKGAYDAFMNDETADSAEAVIALYNEKTAAILTAVRAEYTAKLVAVLADLSEDDYTSENWGKVQAAQTTFAAAIAEETDVAKIVAAFTTARDEMLAVESANDTTAKKNELKAKLEGVVAALDEADYAEARWTDIQNAVKAFNDGLVNCKTEEAVQALYDTQYAALMDAVKDEYTAKFDEYCASLSEGDYTAESWTAIGAAKTAFAADIVSKTTPAEVKAYYEEKLAAVQAIKAYKQSFNFLDYPSTMNKNGYTWIEGSVFDTKLYTGNVKSGLVEFNAMGKDGAEGEGKLSEHSIVNTELNAAFGENTPYHAENWRWIVGPGAAVIAAFKANTDLALTISCVRMADGKGVGWTADSFLNYWIKREDAKLIRTENMPNKDEQFSGTFYLKAGDVLYYEFTISDVAEPGSKRNIETPCNTMVYADSTAFDEEKYVEQNHDLSSEVTDKIAERLADLNEYYESLDKDAYSESNWLTLGQYIEQFEETCEMDVDTVEDVEAAYNAALEGMKSVLTKAQTAEKLQADLQAYADNLQAEYDKLLAENNYSAENKAKLKELLDSGKAEILAATTKTAGSRAYSAALAALKAVETASGGCGSVILASTGSALSLLAVSALSAALIAVRKKKED